MGDRTALIILAVSIFVGLVIGGLVWSHHGWIFGLIAGLAPPAIVAEVLGKSRGRV